MPQLFDEHNATFAAQRERAKRLLGEQQWRAARRSTVNAFHTDHALVGAIWQAWQQLQGPGPARVLEPGCGTGNFIRTAPGGVRMIGVELDPIAAQIAAKLAPSAQVRGESFADTTMSALGGVVDGAIGNVPFGDFALYDPIHNPGREAIHNHFIIKALELTRPGGTVAVLTSRYTLDARSTSHREQMAALGQLTGAFRLPSGAHAQSGTDVVTDLLVFTRHRTSPPAGGDAWVQTRPITVDGHTHQITTAFDPGVLPPGSPAQILGELATISSQHGPVLSVRDTGIDCAEKIRTAPWPTRAQVAVPTAAPQPQQAVADQAPPPAAVVVPATPRFAGELGVRTTGSQREFVIADSDKTWQPAELRIAGANAEELASLITLKAAHRTVLEHEAANTADTPELDQARTQLRETLTAHHQRFGPINRATITPRTRTQPVLDDTGHPLAGADGTPLTEKVPMLDELGDPVVTRRAPMAMTLFRKHDPAAVYVAALERFDEASQTATPATICHQRVLAPRAPVSRTDSPADAIAVCMDTHARLDPDVLAELLQIPSDQVPHALGDLAYTDPVTEQLIPAQEYLSGPVRAKLQQARTAAATDPERWSRNVEALTQVVPADLGPEDITARLGAVWIPASDVEDFAQQIFDDRTTIQRDPVSQNWRVSGGRASLRSYEEYGTVRMDGHELLRRALNQTPVQVWDEHEDGTKMLNVGQSEAARDKQEQLQQRFAEWVWESPQRSHRLARIYNDTFNATVPRREFAYGPMQFPGLAAQFSPRPHQVNAVARAIATGSTGIFHPVGFGKTAVMTMAVMEQKRLGLVNKPAIVVPNHMLEQFSREFLTMYPQARVLAASTDDLTSDRRRAFIARAATEDWDAIIMTRGAFYKLPVGIKTLTDYLDQEIEPLRDWLTNNRTSERATTVKQAEKALARLEEKLKERLDKIAKGTDQTVTFEETGIDYLAVDELHDFKNLATASSIPGAAIQGSLRASDLHQKVWQLRRTHGGRALLGATATPIANSVTELHVMTRYLNPEILETAGLTAFDAWAATFGKTITKVEMSPDGGGLREKTRFAQFQNVPELLMMWAEVGDTLTTEQIAALPRPALRTNRDGRAEPEMVITPASPELEEFITRLGERAQMIQSRMVDPKDDNMLLISSEGRRAALDMRLVPQGSEPTVPTKIDAAAARIHARWAENRDRTYLGPDNTPHPTPGALQLVFCDLGTPTKDDGRFSVYADLRDKLIAHGIPAEQIAFMQNAKTDLDKARLFERARTGQVQVLIGSTSTMGVGTNVQDRAIALHHLDCPWKPAELAQREGRIVRQGNQNDPVEIIRYATEGSFDAYMYQTVARKARFIDQVMAGEINGRREIEDIATDETLTLEQMQMAIANNPLLQEATEVRADLARLRRQETAHRQAQRNLTTQIPMLERYIDQLQAQLPAMATTCAKITPTAGEAFQLRLGHHRYPDRADARDALINTLREPTYRRPPLHLGGVEWQITTRAPRHAKNHFEREHVLTAPTPIPEVIVSQDDIDQASTGIITRMENALRKAPEREADARAKLHALSSELDQAHSRHGRPFPHADALAALTTRLEDLDKALQAEAAKPKDQAPAPPALPQAIVADAFPPLTTPPGTTPAPAPAQRFHGSTPVPRQPRRR
ncbi:helicase [Enemella dayhoffiae]|uniref:Helicase n=1 Tax=Enemella dayhoffiae TaxID=2016507 RepID=A0A255GWR5_9ACTN|nr:helicase-related protein [Enemella dayhoffiae]OYO19912.1 helicase [Enemella dayhoffiae]